MSEPGPTGEGPGAPLVDRLPSGTRDVLPDEMRELRALTERIRGVFDGGGYGEVATPALEFESTFSRAHLPPSAPGYRVFDGHGGVLVLRPDMTVPIARLVATRYGAAPAPLRLCYLASAWRTVRASRGQSREFMQAGIELIGVSDAPGTAEVLEILCATLEAAGLSEFRIGLGDASLFPTLLHAAGVARPDQERILAELARGDFVGVEAALHGLGLSAADAERLLSLTRRRGGEEILRDGDPPLREAIAPLRELHARLAPEIARRIIFDLGLVRSIGYYTGAVFQVYDPAFGLPLGNGGRYDDLLGQFGAPRPAVGFALNLERLHIAVTGQTGGRGA